MIPFKVTKKYPMDSLMIHIESCPSSFNNLNHLSLNIYSCFCSFSILSWILLHMGDLLAGGAWS